MHRPEGARQRARTSTIDTGLHVLAAYDPDRADELERKLRNAVDPEQRSGVREAVAEALFDHDEDEAAMAVLCS